MSLEQTKVNFFVGVLTNVVLIVSSLIVLFFNSFSLGPVQPTFTGILLQVVFAVLLIISLVFSMYILTIGKNKSSIKLQGYAKGSLLSFLILAGAILLLISIGYVITLINTPR